MTPCASPFVPQRYWASSFIEKSSVFAKKNEFLKITRLTREFIAISTPNLDCITSSLLLKPLTITHDPHHPLSQHFICLTSGHRYRLTLRRKARFQKKLCQNSHISSQEITPYLREMPSKQVCRLFCPVHVLFVTFFCKTLSSVPVLCTFTKPRESISPLRISIYVHLHQYLSYISIRV